MSDDYYRILQVDPHAEQEVIEAAYRRLVQKYHPDVLDAAQRQDPEVLRRIQDINQAYAVLRNARSRAQYDKERRNRTFIRISAGEQQEIVESRVYPARCSLTRQTFKLLLTRGKGDLGSFRVAGYEVLAESSSPLLPAGAQSDNWVKDFFNKLFHQDASTPHEKADFLSGRELEAMGESEMVDFGHIDWAGFVCPACAGRYVHPDGMASTWALCGKCSRLYCMGGSVRTPVAGYTICPWCGARRPIAYHVPLGTATHKFARGKRLDPQPDRSSESTLLERGGRNAEQITPSKDEE